MSEKVALYQIGELSEKIMKMKNPVDMKRAAHWKNIKNYDDAMWKETAPKILMKGLTAKFLQNPDLLHYLRSTAPCKLGEASEDPFWGIGMRIGNPEAYKVALWKNNVMGQTLGLVRDQFM